MGTINRGTIWVDGQFLTADELNSEFNIIHDEFNGNIDDANIKAAAAIAGTKISPDFGQQAVTLQELGADPSTLSNKGRFYTKDVSGITELFYKDSGGNVIQITQAGAPLGSANVGNYIHGCLVSPNSVSPTSKIDIATGFVEVRKSDDSERQVIELASAITAIDLSTEGKNGLDDDPANLVPGFYFPYVVFNPSTQEKAGLVSADSSAPTLTHASLSGFTKFRRVGSLYNTASGSASIRDFEQVGKGPDRWSFFEAVNTGNNLAQATSLTSHSISSTVPSTADMVQGIAGSNNDNQTSAMMVAGNSNGLGSWHILLRHGIGSAEQGFYPSAGFIVPMETAQTIYYTQRNANSVGRISITGYRESV